MATGTKKRAEQRKANADNRPYATAKFIRISQGKISVVLDLIRGKSYPEAVAILEHTQKSASYPILKVLKSAGANAENNKGLDKSNMFVAKCYADGGRTLKRVRPQSKGRAYRVLKRTSHITVVLDEKAQEA
ncbi:MAG: 50S ribosomal protein L22 [Clostridia bacterium]|nr:50S ribosomal protein L22 [Clostridia bacterium]